MLIVTAVSLVYVQLQIQIFDFAYQGKKREKAITHLLDTNSEVRSKICLLQSANHLGVKLLDENSKASLKFLSRDQIVQLSMPMVSKIEQASTVKRDKNQNLLANFFLLKSQAEAEPIR